MKKILRTPTKNLIYIFAAAFLQGPLTLAAGHVVKMKSLSFDPPTLQVKVGDTVEWANVSYTEHSATSDSSPSAFDTGRIKPKGASKKITLTAPGSYAYHCSVHGKTMSGEIVVAP